MFLLRQSASAQSIIQPFKATAAVSMHLLNEKHATLSAAKVFFFALVFREKPSSLTFFCAHKQFHSYIHCRWIVRRAKTELSALQCGAHCLTIFPVIIELSQSNRYSAQALTHTHFLDRVQSRKLLQPHVGRHRGTTFHFSLSSRSSIARFVRTIRIYVFLLYIQCIRETWALC